jgi:hypothetical protein
MTIRVATLWEELKARVNSTRMQAILERPDQVFMADEVPDDPPVAGDVPWLRVVLVPVSEIYGLGVEGRWKPVTFLVRTEHSDFTAPGYSKGVRLEAAQEEAYAQLYLHVPDATQTYRVLTELRCTRPPHTAPQWDPLRSLWVLTSEWTLDVIPGSHDQP